MVNNKKKQIFHTTSSGEKPAVQHVPNVLSCWRQRNNKHPSVLVQHWWLRELQYSFQEINFQVDRFEERKKKVLSISQTHQGFFDRCVWLYNPRVHDFKLKPVVPRGKNWASSDEIEREISREKSQKFAQTRREPDGWIIKHTSVHGLTKHNSER